jgi:hypothetical protein
MNPLHLTDPDGDTLRVSEVFGYGEPRLSVRVVQDGGESSVHLTVDTAAALRDWLDGWIERQGY